MSTANEDFQGVSNCYVFKSRLQEYAQKVGLPTPVYETTKDGPPHEPCFKSAVIVNQIRYDSLPGFLNRKAAEQSAAEVALMELAKSGQVNQSITQPVHETGLCKNLLQEYAQKMNYAMPVYQCKKDDTPPARAPFSCTVDIGGILYVGGATKTKKEAEIKAARTALLAIQTNASRASQNQSDHLTVVPPRKRAADSVADEATKAPKAKKARLKKKFAKRKQSRDKKPCVQTDYAGDGANISEGIESPASANDESGTQETNSEAMLPSEAVKNSENGVSLSLASANDESGIQETKSEAMLPSEVVKNSEDGILTNHHEKEMNIHHVKETLARDGSEFQSKEVNLGNVVTEVSIAPNKYIPAIRDIPAKSDEMFVPNGDIPAKSEGIFAPNGDIPAKNEGVFVPNGDILSNSE